MLFVVEPVIDDRAVRRVFADVEMSPNFGTVRPLDGGDAAADTECDRG